jgi:DNA-binding transcriptional LysR family regulator
MLALLVHPLAGALKTLDFLEFNVQLEALKTFCDIVRLRSFSRGAKENDVTQSAASLTVHQLEERLGVALIDRSQRPWKLTHEGKAFYEGCRAVVERYFETEAKVKNLHSEIGSVVRVASIYSVGLGPMNEYIGRFTEMHAGTRVEVDYLHPNKVYDAVLNGDADFGIVSFPQARRDLTVVPWLTEEMTLACPPNHRLSRQPSVKLKEISGEKFVAFEPGLAIRREIDRFLKKHRVDVDTVLEFDNIEAIKNAVEVGSGISLLPRPTLAREVKTGTLAAIGFSPNGFRRPLGFIHRKGKTLHRNASLFLDLLKKEKKEESLA